jgi:hypothetical protein
LLKKTCTEPLAARIAALAGPANAAETAHLPVGQWDNRNAHTSSVRE